MSRFGTTGEFNYAFGDTLTSTTLIELGVQDMFQFPFETSRETDVVEYRSKSGKKYSYQNYNKDVHTFEWVNLRESKRNELFTMVNSPSIFNFESPPGTSWGTYRVQAGSWNDSEVTHELYDVSFTIEKESD